MKKTVSYSDLLLIRGEGFDVIENIKTLRQYGADSVELMMDGVYWDRMDERIEELSNTLASLPMFFSIHPPAWDTNLTSENKAIREATFLEYRKAIYFAHNICAKYVVIHPGFVYCPVSDKRLAARRSRAAVYELNKIAGPLGVKLAVENVGSLENAIFNMDEYIDFLNGTDDNIGYLIDTGHAHLNGWDIARLIEGTSKRLLALHLHDNDGAGDQHLPLETGKINWQPVYRVLKELVSDCQLVLEYKSGTPVEKLPEGKELLKLK
ncbi:MAG: sugar phosphate isomerase/epimerase family protein [Clostridiaceae bacterium]|jgi:sugar phosphate isomerase/epimerase|nr:sugar phosphate isomerase/epimerase family protein [Clostridiaceae bacterium]